MKTERELFEGHFKSITGWDFYWSDSINQYMDHQTNAAWLGWTASAQREGYKLVPVEDALDCLYQISDRSYVDDNVSELKAMIGVIE